MKLLSLICLLLATALLAQQPAKDPFVKEAPKPKPAGGVGQQQEQDIAFQVETITLPRGVAAAWFDTAETRQRVHALATAAVAAGTAKLDGLHYLRSRFDARHSLESVDELVYPSDWDKADHLHGLQYPSAFQMEQMGDVLEIEAYWENKGTRLLVNHAFDRRRFLGFHPEKAAPDVIGAVVPRFRELEHKAAQQMLPESPTLIGTHSIGDSMTLVFVTPRLLPVREGQATGQGNTGNIALTVRVISLPRLDAWMLVSDIKAGDTLRLAALKPLLATKTARLEHLSTLNSQSGNRVTHASGEQMFYGTEFDPPFPGQEAQPAKDDKTPARPRIAPYQASVTSFDCRTLGFRWEAEATRGLESIQTTIAFSHCESIGDLRDPQWHAQYPKIVLFANQQVTTSVRQAPGDTVLISTLNPPGDTGVNERQDSGRVWLLFLETSFQ